MNRYRPGVIVAFCVLLAACAPAAPTLSPAQILVDPDAASRDAVRSGDWRLAATRIPGGQAIEGVRCGIPVSRWSQLTVPLWSDPLTDVADPNHVPEPASPEERRAAARYNALMASHPDAPYRALCRVGGATLLDPDGTLATFDGQNRHVVAGWAVLNPLPPQPRLLAAIRAGQLAHAATLPLDDALEEDFLGLNALGWAVVRDDLASLRRFAADPDARGRFCARERSNERRDERWAIRNQDVFALAIDRGNARAAYLLMTMLSRRNCPEGENEHAINHKFMRALAYAEERREERTIVALVRAYVGDDESWDAAGLLGRQAEGLREGGLPNAAVTVAAMIPTTRPYFHPLHGAATGCHVERFRFWLAQMRPGRDDAFLAYARTKLTQELATRRHGQTGERAECRLLFDMLAARQGA